MFLAETIGTAQEEFRQFLLGAGGHHWLAQPSRLSTKSPNVPGFQGLARFGGCLTTQVHAQQSEHTDVQVDISVAPSLSLESGTEIFLILCGLSWPVQYWALLVTNPDVGKAGMPKGVVD